MPETNIGSSVASDLTNTVVDYSVESSSTDGNAGLEEFRWTMENWEENLGYYRVIPELKTAINTKATWALGAGIKTDPQTELLIGNIRGSGKDSFNGILKNQFVVATIGGDSFAEIIRNKDGYLRNVKPLDPSSMVIVQNGKGMIIRYEQTSRTTKINKRFEVDEIFHLSRERIADEIHGISVITSVRWIILARNEAMADWKIVLHRNVYPLWIFHLDTDDADEIAAFKIKHDNARANGENMYVPKGVVEPEQVTTAQNSTLNPLAWIDRLNDYFFQAVNCPQIIIGNAKEFTDASGKIVYLAYEQSVKADQLYLEEQVLGQLNLDIALTFPASLQNDAISDDSQLELEEEPIEQAAQPNDTTEELEGKQ